MNTGIEDLAAKIERRKKRTFAEVGWYLCFANESIRYVAAIMKWSQDAFLKEGMDISNKPEILATLYNIGLAPIYAKRDREESIQPRENFFGFFVRTFRSDIEATLKDFPGEVSSISSALPCQH